MSRSLLFALSLLAFFLGQSEAFAQDVRGLPDIHGAALQSLTGVRVEIRPSWIPVCPGKDVRPADEFLERLLIQERLGQTLCFMKCIGGRNAEDYRAYEHFCIEDYERDACQAAIDRLNAAFAEEPDSECKATCCTDWADLGGPLA